MSDPDPLAQLIAALDDAARLLRDVGEDFWAGKLTHGRKRVAAGDPHGLREIAGHFGGMGSFNDLLVHPTNGHDVELDEVDEVNGRLDVLRGTIGRRTRELVRELDLR